MTRKFSDLFSVNDPGWGNSHNGGSKDAKDGQGNEQVPKIDPPAGESNKPPVTQPGSQPNKPDGPPDLDELWRDFNDRIAGLFDGKKKPGVGSSANANASRSNSSDIPPPSQRNNGGGNQGGSSGPSLNFNNPLGPKSGPLAAAAIVCFIWVCSGFFIIQEGQAWRRSNFW
ncbi:hypothetical protein [Polynucleobacter necessarius]|uniref:hypothetical protein n=1 Tax=Polynucleobacter necessarius TaxID=576610 RepID=UPI0038CDC660